MQDIDNHPTQEAYDAGAADGKYDARNNVFVGYPELNDNAKKYEDEDAYKEGYWSAFHKHSP